MSGRTIGGRRSQDKIAKVVPPRMGNEVTPQKVDQAIGELATRVNQVLDSSPVMLDVDLVVGTNDISHGLGRRPSFVAVMPRTADATFACGWDPDQVGNPSPTLVVRLTVVGVPMTARVEIR